MCSNSVSLWHLLVTGSTPDQKVALKQAWIALFMRHPLWYFGLEVDNTIPIIQFTV